MQYKYISVLAAGTLVAVSNGMPIAQGLGFGAPTGPTLGKPSSDTTWSKRDVVWGSAPPTPADRIDLGKISTGIVWGKRNGEAPKPKDTFTLGKPTTVVTWNKRDEPADVNIIGDASTVVTWS